MKLLHVYKDFCPPVYGGMERHIGLMCRYQRAWAEVEALVCSRSARTRVVTREGTRITEVAEYGRFQSAPLSPAFPWRLRSARADVVVVHMPNPTAELAWLLARPRARLAVRYHSDVVRQAAAMRLYGPAQMHFLRQAAIILPTSQPYLDTSPTLAPFRDRCRVVPLGIEPERFAAPATSRVRALRERYGGKYVLFAGKHRYYKGLEHLVRAAPAIDAPVVIAGDGPERTRCEAMARELGAAVAFPGELSDEDLVAHVHGSELVVFPSVARSEAFGIGILEAHACGRAVVATQLGTGVEFANLDGETGLNVPPGSAEALADAVNRLLQDPDLRARLGDNARQRVEREFRAEHVARAEFDWYASLLG
jgi:rhamnosyl/mannosyltransferase